MGVQIQDLAVSMIKTDLFKCQKTAHFKMHTFAAPVFSFFAFSTDTRTSPSPSCDGISVKTKVVVPYNLQTLSPPENHGDKNKGRYLFIMVFEITK